MGSYCHLKFGEFSVMSSKSKVIPESMIIFRETDKKAYEEDIDGELHKRYEYANTAKNIKDRLAIMGYTTRRALQNFTQGRDREIGELREVIEEGGHMTNFYAEKLKIIERNKFKNWVNAYKFIRENGLFNDPAGTGLKSKMPRLVRYLIRNEGDYDYLWSFQGGDIYDIFVMFLETCPDELICSMDLSELMGGWCYDDKENICDDSLEYLKQQHHLGAKIVILTEGSSDGHILESALQLLFPHLKGYYSFMNFETSNAAGGASYLASTVKAFAGAGITNRIIAIFDNDTAGTSAMNTLEKTEIPENIKIIQYPDIKTAKRYPTLGPSGIKLLNINKLAASIEIYFGKDSLDNGTNLTPIQWKGYDDKLGQYQGEITEKSKMQKRIFEKIKECTKDSKMIQKYDWDDLRSILRAIFNAFQ